MRKAVLLILALSLVVASCGVKNQLARPDGKPAPRDQPDPSLPPYPIGR
jgi:predicted small lipoprotein YifL